MARIQRPINQTWRRISSNREISKQDLAMRAHAARVRKMVTANGSVIQFVQADDPRQTQYGMPKPGQRWPAGAATAIASRGDQCPREHCSMTMKVRMSAASGL